MQHVVGYHHELSQLQQAWHRVGQGTRQVVMIGGEAGMGKSTLVDGFLADVAASTDVRIAQGLCVEYQGTGDDDFPLLNAFERLARERGEDDVVSVLRQVAPSWLRRLPMLVPAAERDTRSNQGQGTTQAQMWLELSKALEILARASPLILVLEDLHWSDASTVAALAYLTNRDAPANLLILGTYRSVEIQVQGHPLLGFLQEAEVHDRVINIPLTGLTEADIARYWLNRLQVPCLPEMIELLDARSRGNALLLVSLVDHLLDEELVVQGRQGWALQEPLPPAWHLVPHKIRQLLIKQLDQLPPALQHILEVASVAGETFTAAAVSAGAEMALATTEQLCTAVARLGSFVVATGLRSWPDGTVSGQYQFKHDLVRQVAYERVGEGRRARLHRCIGQRLESGYGKYAPEIATTLATHFMHGQDISRAAYYLQLSPHQALLRDTYQEAQLPCDAALELWPT